MGLPPVADPTCSRSDTAAPAGGGGGGNGMGAQIGSSGEKVVRVRGGDGRVGAHGARIGEGAHARVATRD